MLADDLIKSFFDQHLPYRLGMLRAWPRHIAKSRRPHHALGICCYEASLIASRMFTYFLGISLYRDPQKLRLLPKKQRPDDVWIDDLGGSRPQDLSLFSPSEVASLALVYRYTNIASAHLTTRVDVIGSSTSMDRDCALRLATAALLRVLDSHLYSHTGRKLVIWDKIPAGYRVWL